MAQVIVDPAGVNELTVNSDGSINVKGQPTALGQQTMANSEPVVIASNQSAVPVTVPVGQAAMAASTPVAIASNQSAVPVTLPTPPAVSSSLAAITVGASLPYVRVT